MGVLCFDFDFHFGSRFELHFFPVIIDQLIGHSNFLVQVICSFDGDLGFLRFS